MSGDLAVQLAVREPQFAACVVNYAPLSTNIADIEKLNVPEPGVFDALDRGIPSEGRSSLRRLYETVGKQVDIEIYDRVGTVR